MEAYELNVQGVKILYVDTTAEYRRLEGQGVDLAQEMSARLRAALGEEQVGLVLANAARRPVPEGPHFVCEAGPELFLGRRGRGPLQVAWELTAKDVLRPFGLLVATPLDILKELFGCGAFHCMLGPRYLYWPMPDQQRVGHLLKALPSSKLVI